MTRAELIDVGLRAAYGNYATDMMDYNRIAAVLDALEPIIRGDEIAKYDAMWRGAHEQYRRELRAEVQALPTRGIGARVVDDELETYGLVERKEVLALIDGSSNV